MKNTTFLLNPQRLTNFVLKNNFIFMHQKSVNIDYLFDSDGLNSLSIIIYLIDKENLSPSLIMFINKSRFHLHIEDMQQSINDMLDYQINIAKLSHSFD